MALCRVLKMKPAHHNLKNQQLKPVAMLGIENSDIASTS
ncbi:hypothetical protein THERMOS_2329 [Bathymodiolus thermophilus thioautotrophic gill symbiont]|uniref:Uncharacterized protein n=1 Tax=Bathymodiolus thermophilus thioautotrophic gill symbiont TaxID=2360 RepID=A0A8H8XDC9_9GAMM|nr:hypothetical protein THERMOS_2329 [Bathymodiolus thermophilus thioautotrophic gill symbiont]